MDLTKIIPHRFRWNDSLSFQSLSCEERFKAETPGVPIGNGEMAQDEHHEPSSCFRKGHEGIDSFVL